MRFGHNNFQVAISETNISEIQCDGALGLGEGGDEEVGSE
jgi:hypothetical protein